ncbi:MAG: hypothetical protein J3R72DRAFT_428885 [Linnemannia gamsii]|nr:MAG: hypothetical protein J3R72DRAFT_428885 [Linnemannia gamsii]
MTLGFLTRPRSKKRMLFISLTLLLLWHFSPSNPLITDTTSTFHNYLTRPTIHSQMLDHLQKPLCPRFSKYDRQKLLLLETNECTPVESEHPDFSVDVCFSPYMCNEGLVRVRRRDRLQCKEANLRYPISGNSTHDAFYRQFSGPDSFHVVFSGSEKLSPPDWYHAGQCLYVFPFHISNPGKLSLEITHLYDNFGAVVEQSKEWPVLQRKVVVSNLPLEVCRGCPTRVARPRFLSPLSESDSDTVARQKGTQESSKETDLAGQLGALANTDRSSLLALGMSSGSSLRNRYQAYTSGRNRANQYENLVVDENFDRLPLCSREHSVQGVWLPAHPLDKQSWRHANYTWTPLGCRFGKPLDKTCLAGKKDPLKILFQGDTHLRVAMKDLLRRLNGSTTLETNPSTSTATDRLEEKHASTTFTYLHDPLFSNTGEKSDMLVANMGHWATGTKFFDQLMSTSQYHDKLSDLIETIQQHARDLQDLQDEDDGSLGRFLDDEDERGYGGEADDEDGHDYVIEEEEEELEEVEEEDEAELEREREEQLAKETAEEEESGEDVYWEDETEQAIEVDSRHKETSTRHHRRPTLKELEDQRQAMDDAEDKYRIGDRHRAETEGYISRERTSSHDSMDRTARPRYPSNRILRQSKHVKTPAKPKIQVEEPEIEEEEDEEEQQQDTPLVRNRYRYGTQKKVMLDGNSKLTKAGEEEVEVVKAAPASSSSSTSAKNTAPKKKTTLITTPKSSLHRTVSSPAVKKPAAAATAKTLFRDPYAYSTRKKIPLKKSSTSSNNNKSNRGIGATTNKKGSNNNSNFKNKAFLHRRAFLDDDYPILTSSKLPSTPPTSLSSSLSSISSSSDSLVKIAWVGMVAYPETQPADSFVSHDWRTIYRLRYWNLIAEDVMLLHNVRFMDFFSMTLSMLDTSPDRAHYFGTDAAEAMLEELAFKLNLCEDE